MGTQKADEFLLCFLGAERGKYTTLWVVVVPAALSTCAWRVAGSRLAGLYAPRHNTVTTYRDPLGSHLRGFALIKLLRCHLGLHYNISAQLLFDLLKLQPFMMSQRVMGLD